MVNFHCIAEGCTNDSRKKKNVQKYPHMVCNGRVVDFHVLPSAKRNPKLRKQWLMQIRREGFNPNPNIHWHSLCSRHFVDGEPTEANPIPTLFAYNNYKAGKARMTKNSELRPAKSMSAPQTWIKKSVTISTSNKNQPNKKSQQDSLVFSSVYTPTPEDHNYSANDKLNDGVSIEERCATLIDSYSILEEKCQKYEEEIATLNSQVKTMQALKEENQNFRAKLENKDVLFKEILIEKLTKSDNNVRGFLGLPSIALLFGIFRLLEGPASKMKYWIGPKSGDSKQWQDKDQKKPGASRKLSMFEEFLITLLRLRLGLNTYFLSLLFGVSQSTVSKVFTSWISLMAQQLGSLIKWPSRKKIKRHMPLAFRRKYPNTRVIIDATEFFVQRPRNPTAQSRTWSNYKSKNTFKSLVGITPNGTFSFISELWTGNISDRCITQKSGFLDLIEKGDHVMADRGFLIKDLLLSRGANLNMPPFTRPCKHGKGRCLTTKEIRESKQIASLRIHVERAIQRLKSFKFLSGIMQINSPSVANQAVKVAAVLCNFMKPLVRKA